jgi:hypothetical protein
MPKHPMNHHLSQGMALAMIPEEARLFLEEIYKSDVS